MKFVAFFEYKRDCYISVASSFRTFSETFGGLVKNKTLAGKVNTLSAITKLCCKKRLLASCLQIAEQVVR